MTNKFYMPGPEGFMKQTTDLLKESTENSKELVKIANSIDRTMPYISDYSREFNILTVLLIIIIVELAFIGYKFHKNK